MKVLYVTANVLGDPGANAAEIFPRLAVQAPQIDEVIVADYERNRSFIRDRQKAEFLRLKDYGGGVRQSLRDGMRIAKKAKDRDVDIIHVFYRQQNAVLIIFMRVALLLLWARAIVLMDHRSVNLARGANARRKKLLNLVMQVFAHRLAGNPLAAETNHYVLFKPADIIDLGYDALPEGEAVEPAANAPCTIWFIGSLKPRNRKSEFLIEIFARIAERRDALTRPVEIHVAGPTRPDQKKALMANPSVTYHGALPRAELYKLLRAKPGVGVAFMNTQFHAAAPSLKFVEYAIMRYAVVASDTPGLRTQGRRMNLPDVEYVVEDPDLWADRLIAKANGWAGLVPVWSDAELWSYTSIFERQVLGLYERIT
jgi:glycosyltransferase involved in cell wall biosynthesis